MIIKLSKSQLLLTEIMVSILIFLVTTTVCMLLLFNSAKLTKETIEDDNIYRISISILEISLKDGIYGELLTEIYNDGKIINDNKKAFFFDNDFKVTNENNAIYTFTIEEIEIENDMHEYIVVAYKGEEVYKLSSKN